MSDAEPVAIPQGTVSPSSRALRFSTLVAVAAGVAYGLLFRWLFDREELEDFFGVMSFAFIFLVPTGIGYLTVWLGERDGRWSWWARTFIPWVTSIAALAAALALAWEGLICIFLWLPLFIVEATIGAYLAVLVRYLVRKSRTRRALTAGVLALPLLVGPAERLAPLPEEIRTVATSIDIDASPEAVWRQIARVPRFAEHEHTFSFSHWIGFPRPVEATLSREGVGGIRHASFEGEVVFVETVTVWEPPSRLAFTIDADPTSIPMQTLDRHVTVGGAYFDVLEGAYRIEPLASGGVRLHLASRHRVSTPFNPYARLWTDFILADTQRTILRVIRRRAEEAPAGLVVEFLEARFPYPLLELSIDSYLPLLKEVRKAGLTGGSVYDALAAATARHAGGRLLTSDRRALGVYEALRVPYELID